MNGRSKSVVMAFAVAMAVGLVAEARGVRSRNASRSTGQRRVSRTTTGTRSTRRAPAYGHKLGKRNGYDSPGDDTFKSRRLRYDSPGDDILKSRRLAAHKAGEPAGYVGKLIRKRASRVIDNGEAGFTHRRDVTKPWDSPGDDTLNYSHGMSQPTSGSHSSGGVQEADPPPAPDGNGDDPDDD